MPRTPRMIGWNNNNNNNYGNINSPHSPHGNYHSPVNSPYNSPNGPITSLVPYAPRNHYPYNNYPNYNNSPYNYHPAPYRRYNYPYYQPPIHIRHPPQIHTIPVPIPMPYPVVHQEPVAYPYGYDDYEEPGHCCTTISHCCSHGRGVRGRWRDGGGMMGHPFGGYGGGPWGHI